MKKLSLLILLAGIASHSMANYKKTRLKCAIEARLEAFDSTQDLLAGRFDLTQNLLAGRFDLRLTTDDSDTKNKEKAVRIEILNQNLADQVDSLKVKSKMINLCQYADCPSMSYSIKMKVLKEDLEKWLSIEGLAKNLKLNLEVPTITHTVRYRSFYKTTTYIKIKGEQDSGKRVKVKLQCYKEGHQISPVGVDFLGDYPEL